MSSSDAEFYEEIANERPLTNNNNAAAEMSSQQYVQNNEIEQGEDAENVEDMDTDELENVQPELDNTLTSMADIPTSLEDIYDPADFATNDDEERIAFNFLSQTGQYFASIRARQSAYDFFRNNCEEFARLKAEKGTLKVLKSHHLKLKRLLPPCRTYYKVVTNKTGKARYESNKEVMSYNMKTESIAYHYSYVCIKDVVKFHNITHNCVGTFHEHVSKNVLLFTLKR